MATQSDTISAAVKTLAMPEEVQEKLARVAGELMATGVVRAIAVYGGVARGRYVEGRSDINVLVILAAADHAALAALRDPMENAPSSLWLEPMFVTGDELSRVALVFPVKFLDIAARHITIAGDDAILGRLAVPLTNARLRVEQEFRNLELRTRRRLVSVLGDDEETRECLASLARPFAVELASLLAVDGFERPDDDRTAVIFAQAAGRYGLDAKVLDELARLRNGEGSGRPLDELAMDVLKAIGAAAAAAGRGG
ncbi:MAG: hypothetical protein JNL80_18480 [Phycisphaerae bacterium]|nr:hypothetical protein [Phycisphaerae bacterium]